MKENFNLLPENEQKSISKRYQKTEDQFSKGAFGINKIVSSKEDYNRLVQNISQSVSIYGDLFFSKYFHEQMPFYKKIIGQSEAEQRLIEVKTEVGKAVIISAVIAAAQAIPYCIMKISQDNEKKKFFERLVAYSSWVNQTTSLLYLNKLKTVLSVNNIDFNDSEIDPIFGYYSKSEVAKLPSVNLSNDSLLFFKLLSYLSDTNDVEHYKRLYALGKEGFGIDGHNIEEILLAAKNGQLLTSDFALFTSYFTEDYVSDLFINIPAAMQFAKYNRENDPFRAEREKRYEMLKNTSVRLGVGAALASLTTVTGGLGDALIAFAGPMLFNYVDHNDIKKVLEFTKNFKSMKNEISNKK